MLFHLFIKRAVGYSVIFMLLMSFRTLYSGTFYLDNYGQKLFPAGDIIESIPFAGTWKLSKVKDVKADGVWIERPLTEGKNSLPVRFLLNKTNDTSFYITASRENILFNFGEQAPGYLRDGRLRFNVLHYRTPGDTVRLTMDVKFDGKSIDGILNMHSEASEAMAEGTLSMKIANPSDNNPLNGVFVGNVTLVSAEGDGEMIEDLQQNLHLLIQYTDQLILQVGDLAAFTWMVKRGSRNALFKNHEPVKQPGLFGYAISPQGSTYMLLGYFISRTDPDNFVVKIDDELLKTIGVPEDPKHKKSQEFDFSRSAEYLDAQIYEWEEVLDDSGNVKTAEVTSSYQGSPVEELKQFLKVDVVPLQGSEVKCGEAATIEIKLLNHLNKVDTEFDGGAAVTLLNNSTPGLSRLPAEQSVSLNHGIAQPVFFFTPKEPFDAAKPVFDATVFSGDVYVKVQLENSDIPPVVKHVRVKSPFDFYIDKIEVNQSVYGTDKPALLEYLPGIDRSFPALPFITGHNTLVQVYVDIKNKTAVQYSKIELTGLTGELNLYKDDVFIKTFDLKNSGPTGNRAFNYKDTFEDSEYGQMKDAFYVYLNNVQITAPGTYSFKAILTPEKKLEETESDKKNNELAYTGSFVQTKSLSVLYYVGQKIGEPEVRPHPDMWNFLKNVYPIQNTGFIVDGAPFTIGFQKSSDITFSFLNNLLNRYNKENPRDQREYLLMVADTVTVHEACSGLQCGGCTPSLWAKSAIVTQYSASTPAHELGHILGLRDTYKTKKWKTSDGEPNPRRSNAADAGNPVKTGDMNFLSHIKVSPQGSTPYFEYMGLGDFVDRVTWNHLYQTRFRIASENEPEPLSKTLQGGFIAVSGAVKSDGTGSLYPLITLDQVPKLSESEQGEYIIEFLNNSGSLLASHKFSVESLLPETENSPGIPFSLYLAFPAGTGKIILKKGASAIASRIISQNPPQVQLLSPVNGETITGEKVITWTGSDADGSSITYDLLYSPDGITQNVIAVNLNGTSHTWNSSQWASSSSTGKISVIANDGFNEARASAGNLTIKSPVGITDKKRSIPSSYSLRQNFPNPFNPVTTVRFELPAESVVTLRIYDLQGRLIRTLADEAYRPGIYDIDWNGENDRGESLANGMYFIEMKSGEYYRVIKAMLIK